MSVSINRYMYQLIGSPHRFPSTLATPEKGIQPTKRSPINNLLIGFCAAATAGLHKPVALRVGLGAPGNMPRGGAAADAYDPDVYDTTQTIQLTAGTHTLTVVTAAVSMFNVLQAGGENGSEVASAVALLPEVTAVSALRAEHRGWWASYWNASSISLPAQPVLEDFYFRSLYLLGSAARSTSLVPPGLCGAWFAGSGPSRYGVSE